MAQSLQPCVSYPDLSTPDTTPGKTGALKGKVALIAGYRHGWGRAVALELAVRGAKVAVNYHRPEARAEVRQVVDAINNMNPGSVLLTAILIEADATSPEGVELLFQSTLDAFRVIDIVVSNADQDSYGHIADVTEPEVDVFAANFKGHVLVAKQAYHKINAGGRLVLISSAGTQHPSSGSQCLFNSGRAAVETLVRSLPIDFSDMMVTINGIAPGIVKDNNQVEPTEELLRTSVNPTAENIGTCSSRFSPLNSASLPEDIARVVAFLVSDDGVRVNGQMITMARDFTVH